MNFTTFNQPNDITIIHRHGRNKHNFQCLFDDDNYQAMLKRLDDGHEDSKELIEYMQIHRRHLRSFAKRTMSHSKKTQLKLSRQQTLLLYNTTRIALIQTVHTSEEHATLINKVCDDIKQVIDQYKKQVNETYKRKTFGIGYEHRETNQMKKLFEAVYAPLRKTNRTLERLQKQEIQAQNALHNAEVQCQNLSLDPTTTEIKRKQANNSQKVKNEELEEIRRKIAQAVDDQESKKALYRTRATDIFNQCQELEKTRLDQLQQKLIEFSQAVYSSEYSTAFNRISEDLLSKIKTEHNPSGDLALWAQAHGVKSGTESVSSDTDDTTGSIHEISC